MGLRGTVPGRAARRACRAVSSRGRAMGLRPPPPPRSPGGCAARAGWMPPPGPRHRACDPGSPARSQPGHLRGDAGRCAVGGPDIAVAGIDGHVSDHGAAAAKAAVAARNRVRMPPAERRADRVWSSSLRDRSRRIGSDSRIARTPPGGQRGRDEQHAPRTDGRGCWRSRCPVWRGGGGSSRHRIGPGRSGSVARWPFRPDVQAVIIPANARSYRDIGRTQSEELGACLGPFLRPAPHRAG